MDVFEQEAIQKQKSGLVEDFEALSISMLGRGLLHDDKKRSGIVSIGECFQWPQVRFEVCSLDDGRKQLYVWHFIAEDRVPTFQEIALEGREVTFGMRPYLVCPSCASLRLKLQFTRLGRFACRSCLNLTYQCCRENHSKPIFQQHRRYMKLRMKQTNVKRIDYAGRLTRKAKSVMKMAERWV